MIFKVSEYITQIHMNHYFETFMALFVIFWAVLVLYTKTTNNCFGNVNTVGEKKERWKTFNLSLETNRIKVKIKWLK